jgi:hypothetical protein
VKAGSVDLAHLAHFAQSVDLAQPPHRLQWAAGHRRRVLRGDNRDNRDTGDVRGDKGSAKDFDLESCGLESFAMPPSA